MNGNLLLSPILKPKDSLSNYNPTSINLIPVLPENSILCEDLLAQMQRFFDMLQNACRTSEVDWLTVENIAEELKISKNVVYRSIRNGHIAQRGHYRIRRSSLKKYLEAKKVKTLPDDPVRTSRPRRFPKVKNHLGL